MTRGSLLICVVIAITDIGCGGSSLSANQRFAPAAVPPRLASLAIGGQNSLMGVGDTAQLTVLATWSDGTMRDVTADVSWTSRDPSVVTITPRGLATAIGFGVATIEVEYQSSRTGFPIGVTPPGTFVVKGDVREPGQGALAGVRVSEVVSGRSTVTDQLGQYVLAALASNHLRFDKEGYEPGTLDIAPDFTGYMRMQRIVHITAGETVTVPDLTLMDMSYDVGADRCSPCRLIRITAPRAGTMRFELAWEPNLRSELHLWAGGQHFTGNLNEQSLAAEARVTAGENLVHVGYYRWKVLSGSSIQFRLTTAMTP